MRNSIGGVAREILPSSSNPFRSKTSVKSMNFKNILRVSLKYPPNSMISDQQLIPRLSQKTYTQGNPMKSIINNQG